MILSKIISLLKGKSHANGTRVDSSARKPGKCGGFHSFAAQSERAVSDLRGLANLTEALADERSRNAHSDSRDPVLVESELLLAAAQESGMLVKAVGGDPRAPRVSEAQERISLRTGESEVYWDAAHNQYLKIKNPFAKAHLKKHPITEAIYEHVVHNILFPECPLNFKGITSDNGEARFVFTQAAVCADRRPTDAQIAAHLSSLGLQPEGRYAFGNELLFVTDVGENSDNVLLGDDDKLYFIDPIIGFKKPALKLINDLIKEPA